ncbi:MAG: hypothetical protein KL787_08075 [Taibaiella sp.]|nr:hypothetical protein [Taibaiella sp.]
MAKPFFGDDPNATLKKPSGRSHLQVSRYMTKEENSPQYSGFDDGNTTKNAEYHHPGG